MGRKKPRREILAADWVMVDASGSIIYDASGGLFFVNERTKNRPNKIIL